MNIVIISCHLHNLTIMQYIKRKQLFNRVNCVTFFIFSLSKLCQSLLAHLSSQRPPPQVWPSPGTLATQILSPTTSSSTEPKGRTASMRRLTASPPPAIALGDCTLTLSMKSECQPSIALARALPPYAWRLAQESRHRPALLEMSTPTLFLKTLWWSAGRSRRNPMDRWDEDWNSSF